MNMLRVINLAVKEAKKSQHKQKMGCVIFRKKNIISIGYNAPLKSAKNLHPQYTRWPNSIHAEVDAILKAKANLVGSEMIVIRINNQDQFRMAKPCIYCMKYITHVGIRKIHYSLNEKNLLQTLVV